MIESPYKELFDREGNLVGVLLSPEAWEAAEAAVRRAFPDKAAVQERPEPIGEWEYLLQYWDFPYPADYDVRCPLCGNETQDWREDEPRRFRLSSANLAGLVAFKCCSCKAHITKRHFKNEIKVEAKPYLEEKDPYKEARYKA